MISVVTPSIRPEGLKPNQTSLENQTFQDFEWLVELGIPGRGHDLNAAFNRMLKRAKGELIVFMEDYTTATPEGLQKFWDAYQTDKKILWTAPLGKTIDGKDVKWDWRAFKDATNTTYNCWEIDWGSCPLSILQEIGGFDEELDKHWSSDNVNTGYRAYLNGYNFKNLFENPAIAYDHDAVMEHPFRQNYNPVFNKERMDSFQPGVKLTYL